MSEATGMEAKTIHRMLEYKPADGYKRNEENPLQGDALIVDECSMIDIILMNSLMKAIPESMRLVLTDHFVMLQRNLIYTGITRAKKI